MRACYGGHYNVVVLLLQHGADVHIKSSVIYILVDWHTISQILYIVMYSMCEQRDWTALLIAASQNHLRIANRLLREGAKPNDVIDPDEVCMYNEIANLLNLVQVKRDNISVTLDLIY